jgi:hypothetical protein
LGFLSKRFINGPASGGYLSQKLEDFDSIKKGSIDGLMRKVLSHEGFEKNN